MNEHLAIFSSYFLCIIEHKCQINSFFIEDVLFHTFRWKMFELLSNTTDLICVGFKHTSNLEYAKISKKYALNHCVTVTKPALTMFSIAN